MSSPEKSFLEFRVETSRVLEVLAREIYDSPNALLRENVQNGYDAILERCVETHEDLRQRAIRVNIDGRTLTIEDDGVGMARQGLAESFWRPGASGKHTERAMRAGVVGTFGIGAMANFGVCDELVVETENTAEGKRWRSSARRNELEIGKQCISLDEIPATGSPGTTITATLQPSFNLDENTIQNYLRPYVRYLPVPVLVGSTNISQEEPQSLEGAKVELVRGGSHTAGQIAYRIDAFLFPDNRIRCRLYDISMHGESVQGELRLEQNGQQVMAFCNFFGLSAVPVSSHYAWGGMANLALLRPTAGREALSRESIGVISQFMTATDKQVSELLGNRDEADSIPAFLNYIRAHDRVDLAGRVTVTVVPDGSRVQLCGLAAAMAGKTPHWYGGNNSETVAARSSLESPLIHLDASNPRRTIQQKFITSKLSYSPVGDNIEEQKRYVESELSIAELSLQIKLIATLVEDYGFDNPDVYFAEFSHKVPFVVSFSGDLLSLAIRRDAAEVLPVIACYREAREVFSGVVKDFVRVHLYNRFQNHVPSATRMGADALIAQLRKNRELFRYEETDRAAMEDFLRDIGMGKVPVTQLLARSRGRAQTQVVTQQQVADASIIHQPQNLQNDAESRPAPKEPAPPIRRPSVETLNVSIIESNDPETELNGYRMLLSLSRRVFHRERDFFFQPHSSNVIWAGHRIIYIFGHSTSRVSFYYDIELKEELRTLEPNGEPLVTTTVITKDRIFVPVPDVLMQAFQVDTGPKEFFVRYDTIVTQDE